MGYIPRGLPPAKYIRECFYYDPLAGALTWRVRPLSHFPNRATNQRWNTRFAGKRAGYNRKDGYQAVGINNMPCLIHRVIWIWMTGGEAYNDVDHVNLNRSDNRWSNLRLADRSQNSVNSPKHVDNTTGYKGVSKYLNKFGARIWLNGKEVYLGTFDTPQEAHKAYCDAAKAPHGVFFHP